MEYKTVGYEGPVYVAYYYFIRWTHVSFGLHFDLGAPNMEIHLPFGFIRVGRRSDYKVIRDYKFTLPSTGR